MSAGPLNLWRSERREKERQARSAGRLPPGQSLTEKFPVLTYEPSGEWPSTDLARFTLDVFGLVENPLSLNFDVLSTEFDVVDLTFDIHCVTRWSKLETTWHGVRVRDILERAVPKPNATYLISHSTTGYTANVPLENAISPNSLVAWQFDGRPLEPAHGGPVRAIIDPENLYFWKSAKFLKGFELSESDQPGFWEKLGYNNRGNIWKEERFWNDSGFETRRGVIRATDGPRT